jgi:hypothetical protein
MRAYVCRKTGEQVSDWTVLLCQQAQPGGSLSWNTSLGGGMQGVKERLSWNASLGTPLLEVECKV